MKSRYKPGEARVKIRELLSDGAKSERFLLRYLSRTTFAYNRKKMEDDGEIYTTYKKTDGKTVRIWHLTENPMLTFYLEQLHGSNEIKRNNAIDDIINLSKNKELSAWESKQICLQLYDYGKFHYLILNVYYNQIALFKHFKKDILKEIKNPEIIQIAIEIGNNKNSSLHQREIALKYLEEISRKDASTIVQNMIKEDSEDFDRLAVAENIIVKDIQTNPKLKKNLYYLIEQKEVIKKRANKILRMTRN